jgi:hypothetical protein
MKHPAYLRVEELVKLNRKPSEVSENSEVSDGSLLSLVV